MLGTLENDWFASVILFGSELDSENERSSSWSTSRMSHTDNTNCSFLLKFISSMSWQMASLLSDPICYLWSSDRLWLIWSDDFCSSWNGGFFACNHCFRIDEFFLLCLQFDGKTNPSASTTSSELQTSELARFRTGIMTPGWVSVEYTLYTETVWDFSVNNAYWLEPQAVGLNNLQTRPHPVRMTVKIYTCNVDDTKLP